MRSILDPSPQREPRGLASSLGPSVRFVTGTAVELLLSAMPTADPGGRTRMTDGDAWAAKADRPALRSAGAAFRRIQREPIINLLGLAFESPEPRTGRDLLARMRALPGEALVFNMVGGYRRTVRRLTSPEIISDAVAGDEAARREFRRTSMPDVDHWQAALRYLLSASAERIAEQTIEAFAAWHQGAVAPLEDSLAEDQADTVARLQVERTALSLAAVLPSVAPGIEYQPPAEVDDIVFMPAVAIRPLVAFLDHRNAAIIAFAASDPADADHPPASVVLLGKALGDELRLRALRALADGPSTLVDLAHELGVPRTTLSHHIGLMRAAGLVTLTIDDGRTGRLALRTDVVDDLPRLLREFLAGR
jgi:DNA-binding transcriptional ArsR family regulator